MGEVVRQRVSHGLAVWWGMGWADILRAGICGAVIAEDMTCVRLGRPS